MTKLIIISILFLSSIAFSGEVYKWTDANGVTRFSNTAPPKDAQMIGKETNYVAPAQISQPSQSSGFDESKRPHQKLIDDKKKTYNPVKEDTPYKFSWSSPRVSNGVLSINGNVEYGESCKSLTVTAWLFDENSNRTFIKCQASDVGGSASRILSGKSSIPSRWGSNWKIESTDASCSQ